MQGSRNGPKDQRWASLLWSAALETWAHQLLYTRGVYPRDSFVPVRFLGVQCYANRHPDVVAYIQDTVKAVVPALQNGAADQVSMLITCEEDNGSEVILHTLEEYSLRRFGFRKGDSSTLNNHQADTLERSLRDLVLAVHALPKNTLSSHPQSASVSFRLELRLEETSDLPVDLIDSLDKGKWYVPQRLDEDVNKVQGHVIRPFYRADTPIGTLQFVQRRKAKQPK